MSTFGYGFLADWKLWLRLSTFVNAWFLYEVSDTLTDTFCQHCHPWNGCILLSENIWCERDTGYPNVPLHPQVCSACLCRYFFAKVSPALQTSNTGLKIFLKRGLSVFSAFLEVCLIECLRFWELQKNILRASWKTCWQKGKNQSVWYRWTKASESSWKNHRHGSASIFPNVFRMWARRKSPTDSWFMTSRTEGLMKRWHRWRQQEWLKSTAADAHSWYSFRFRHHR